MKFKPGDKVRVKSMLDNRRYYIANLKEKESRYTWGLKLLEHTAPINIGVVTYAYETDMKPAEVEEHTIRELMT